MTKQDKNKLPIGQGAESFGEGDCGLAASIRQLAMILMPVASELRAASENGAIKNLIDWLRSDLRMECADRDLLADVLEGDLGRHHGRPERKANQKALNQEALAAYRALMVMQPRPKKDQAAQTVANQYGITPDQVLSIVKKAPRKIPLIRVIEGEDTKRSLTDTSCSE